MSKQEFLAQLRKGLSALPPEEIEERLNFYSEMIDDRMEEGLSEEDAVSSVGDNDEITALILADGFLAKPQKPKKKLGAWEIVRLSIGSPIWLALLIAAFAVVFSLYVSLWAVIIALWATFVALVVCAIYGIVMCGVIGIGMLGGGFICAGLSIFLFFGCRAATKGTLFLSKKLCLWIRSWFVKKEEA